MRTCLVSLFLVLACLQELDILSTHYIIHTLGGCELNPAMAAIVDSPYQLIAVKIGYLLLIGITVHTIEKISTQNREKRPFSFPPWTGIAILGIACFWYIIVVSYNTAAMLHL